MVIDRHTDTQNNWAIFDSKLKNWRKNFRFNFISALKLKLNVGFNFQFSPLENGNISPTIIWPGTHPLPTLTYQRRYEIINIPHDSCAYQCVSSWVCPSYCCCVEAQKSRDPQGIPSLNSVVSIVDHGHNIICFVWGSRGITLENRC